MMIFASDNWPGAHPLIAQKLADAAGSYASPYGEGETDQRVVEKLSVFFEREVAAFFVATGTAANSLALASVSDTAPLIFCHPEAHVIHHEGGAVEFMTSGGKLVPVAGDGKTQGKIDPVKLQKAIGRYPAGDVHIGQKAALTLSQVTEAGTVYSLDEIATLAGIAKTAGMKVHMDGARFSNAIATLGVTPAEMTWKSGIDIVSLGGTKNGCWCAEAIVYFDPADAAGLPYLRKRAANLFSKSNFIAQQFDRWLDDGLWLDLARHSNRMAMKLANAVKSSGNVRLAWETGSSQQFIIMSDDKAAELRKAGARFYDWETPEGLENSVGAGEQIRRFITHFATREEDVDTIAALF
jgi:threonine aldolase